MKNFKAGFITIIGRPNVGKSTLLNQLIGQQISIIANKPQTTRNQIRGIITTEEYQAVLIDNPGIHLPQNELHRRIVNYALASLKQIDLIVYIVEPLKGKNSVISDQDQKILEMIAKASTPIILMINKIDLSNDIEIFQTIDIYAKKYNFAEIIPISALKKKGLEKVLTLLPEYLPKGVLYYPEDQITDAPERIIVAEFIREQIFHQTFQEIPYSSAVIINQFKEEKSLMKIDATIFVEKDSHKKIIIGKKAQMLKTIGINARKKIEYLLGIKVFLLLHVKVSENWCNNPHKLNEFGYHHETSKI